MSNQFRYYIHEGAEALSFELAGDVSDTAAGELEQAWRAASSLHRGRRLIIDLSYVTHVEQAGRAMLRRWAASGAQLVARLPLARAIVELISGKCSDALAGAAQRSTWLPFHLAAWAVGLTMLLAAAPARAANLKPETLQTWEEYIQGATARTRQHFVPGGKFLSVDEMPGESEKLRAGQIWVSPAGPQTPAKVPSGLIHDWLGAAFIPGVRIPDVLRVVRDYACYKDVYRPNVAGSRPIVTGEEEDRFSLLIRNKSAFAGGALESDYRTTYTRLDDGHWYSITEATRVREVADYGSPAQHTLPENQGSGMIWRLFSITRFEERDGGVYVEVEAMALSRDIPASLRWLVEPLVRRISRSALATSLQQTGDAVRSAARGTNGLAFSAMLK